MTGEEPANELFEQGKPLIIAAWHGRLFMMPCGWRHRGKMHVLISSHGDGQLISKTMGAFRHADHRPASTRKGGAEALLRLRRILRDGGAVGITPDGPRGPRMRASLGIVQLARITKAPIFPLTYSAAAPACLRKLGPVHPAASLLARPVSVGRRDRRSGGCGRRRHGGDPCHGGAPLDRPDRSGGTIW